MSALTRYRAELRLLRGATPTVRDFVALLRVRLSLSRVGWLVCPRPIVAEVHAPAFGGPIWLRSHSSDVSVLKELLAGLYALPFREGAGIARIVDLGANNGLAARWLLRRYAGARIVCVEPEPGNLAMLHRNLAPVRDRAVVVEACAGARERTVSLTTSAGAWAYEMRDEPGAVTAPVVTMDTVIAAGGFERVDLLKVNVEGAERELFAAPGPWIERVDRAVVEWHEGDPAPLDRLGALRVVERGHFVLLARAGAEPEAVRPTA